MKGGAKRWNARRVISPPPSPNAEYQLLSFGACIQFHGQLLATVQSPLKRAAEKQKRGSLWYWDCDSRGEKEKAPAVLDGGEEMLFYYEDDKKKRKKASLFKRCMAQTPFPQMALILWDLLVPCSFSRFFVLNWSLCSRHCSESSGNQPFFAPSPNWYEVGDDTLTQVDTAPPRHGVFLLSPLKSMLTILIKHPFKQVAANRGLTMLFSERWNVSEIARVNISELTRNHKPYLWRSISGALALAN